MALEEVVLVVVDVLEVEVQDGKVGHGQGRQDHHLQRAKHELAHFPCFFWRGEMLCRSTRNLLNYYFLADKSRDFG